MINKATCLVCDVYNHISIIAYNEQLQSLQHVHTPYVYLVFLIPVLKLFVLLLDLVY